MQELRTLRDLFYKHRAALDAIMWIGSPLDIGKVRPSLDPQPA
jgi:hypothetical protein